MVLGTRDLESLGQPSRESVQESDEVRMPHPPGVMSITGMPFLSNEEH